MTHNCIYGIQCICTYHTYLINDEQFHFTQQFFLFIVKPDVAEQRMCISNAIVHTKKMCAGGYIRTKGQLEKRMHCYTSGIDGSNTCWRNYYCVLGSMILDIFQESCFTGTRFTGKKKMAVCMINIV